MPKPILGDAEFIVLFEKYGATELARIIGINVRNVFMRRARIEKKSGASVLNPEAAQWLSRYPSRVPFTIETGTVLIASDAHYWPGVITTAHRGFVKFIENLKPDHVVMNGDVFDGARASRHPRIMWEHSPTIKQELEAVSDRLHEIVKANPKAKHLWTIGNHDSRFESSLSNNSADYENVQGFALRDHFPLWEMALSFWINTDVVVKHRFKGGIHATHNNTLWSGKTMVTGHLHSLKVTPYSDYTGLRFGVDTGTLTVPSTDAPGGPQTNYNEDNPQNHRSGFIVLTFKDGLLLWPEIAYVVDEGLICFRGQITSV